MRNTLTSLVLFFAVFQASVPTTTWVQNQGYTPSGFSSGMVILLVSGSCPTGFTELSALNGMLPRGTLLITETQKFPLPEHVTETGKEGTQHEKARRNSNSSVRTANNHESFRIAFLVDAG